MRLFPAPGPWSVLAPLGIRRLSSSNELGAQYVSPHQTAKRKETTPESRVPAWFLCHGMMQCRCENAAKKGVSDNSEWLHLKEYASLGSLGRPEPREFSKRVQNGKADCYILLKRITRLKCVNSEFRSVDIYPKRGCLNWPYGTMSEPP